MKLTEIQINKIQKECMEDADFYADNAFGWWVQETFTKSSESDLIIATRVLKMIEDSDYDLLPSIDWSGQWADGPSWQESFQYAFEEAVGQDFDDLSPEDQMDMGSFSDDLFLELSDGNIVEMIEKYCNEILNDQS
jgi:hypothetical protein